MQFEESKNNLNFAHTEFEHLKERKPDPFEDSTDWTDNDTMVLVGAFIDVNGFARHTIIKAIGGRFGARQSAKVASVMKILPQISAEDAINILKCKQLWLCVCVCVCVCMCVCVYVYVY